MHSVAKTETDDGKQRRGTSKFRPEREGLKYFASERRNYMKNEVKSLNAMVCTEDPVLSMLLLRASTAPLYIMHAG